MPHKQVRVKKIRGGAARVGWGVYSTVHKWLRRNYGAPSRCEGKDCRGISKNLQYALRRGFEYEKKRENFLQLCSSCHTRYDFTEETLKKMSKNRLGKPRPDISRPITVIMSHKTLYYPSITACAKSLKCSIGSVGNALYRKTKYKGLTISYSLPLTKTLNK